MYIKKVEITNIRAIEKFEMTFDHPAGWHVLIGDNGFGKTTILRAIALALIGSEQAAGLRANWKDWVRKGEQQAEIALDIFYDLWNEDHPYAGVYNQPSNSKTNDRRIAIDTAIQGEFRNNIYIKYSEKDDSFKLENNEVEKYKMGYPYNWDHLPGWLSTGFGPFRRFTGGSEEWNEVYKNKQLVKLSAHLTLFNESVALTETTGWLMKLKFQQLEGSSNFLDSIQELVNSPDFLPNETKLNEISSEGVTFIDKERSITSINQLSDGFRSILSLTFELLRQIIQRYEGNLIFSKIDGEHIKVIVPGVVLIDEIDAHLHPTWQTRIGQWFTKYFPNIQFIVTTHSPLVCRACENGSIWRLASPGSEHTSGEITGTDRDRLIYGNVLDAYGTEVFGEDVSQSANAEAMLKELADLNVKSFKGTITDTDKRRMQDLKKILPTE